MWQALWLSVALHGFGLLGLAWAALQTDMPWVGWIRWPGQSCQEATVYYPVWHLGDLLAGASSADVHALLGEPALQAARPVVEHECWRYRFLGDASLTLRFHAGVVRQSWFGGNEPWPAACRGTVRRSVYIPRSARPPAVAGVGLNCGFWM
jgi:hypothetical protein